MYMDFRVALTILMCADGVLALNFGCRYLAEKKPKDKVNNVIVLLYFASCVWSFGFGLMLVQFDDRGASVCRAIFMFACFSFMMLMQTVICMVSGISKKAQFLFNGIAYSGYIVYFLSIFFNHAVFVESDWGYTFYFLPGIVNTIYVLYFTIVSFGLFGVTFYMIKSSKFKRVKVIGTRCLIVEMITVGAAVGDMMLPSFGFAAFPGSAISQFWALFVFWFALHNLNRSKITVSNMSEYIYKSLSTPLLVFDSDYNVRIINGAASEYLHIEDAMVNSVNVKIGQLFDIGEEAFDFEEQFQIKTCNCHASGAQCELRISKITDPYTDEIGYIVIVGDLTEHNNVIRRLEQAKMEADAANMSKSLFLANMSHEIRTPMNAIMGFSELALKDDVNPLGKEYISDMRRSASTLLAIINDILSISKIELGKYELSLGDYKPSKIFNDVALIVGVQAREKGLDFKMTIDEKLPDVLYGDKDKIREILINLLNNAVKYTKVGAVFFDVEVLTKVDDEVVIRYKVKDSGIGIREEDLGKIFEKFSRMDAKINSETEGTGLGLSITHGLVDLMGGTIGVESVYGVGSMFTVDIPQKIIDAKPIEMESDFEASNEKKEIRFKDLFFLAVDDNRVNLKVISKVMDRYGIKYDLATSGEESIKLCKEKEYDVILMDQMMPVMDGVEAMKRIRMFDAYKEGAAPKIIALTANVIEGVKEQLIAEGFDDFLGKPIDFATFESVLAANLPKEKIEYVSTAPEPEKPTNIKQLEKYIFNDGEKDMSKAGIIDYKAGLDNLVGDEDDYREILEFVADTFETDIDELMGYYNDKNIEDFVIKVHGMKSQCYYVGGQNIGDMAKDLEFAGKARDIAFIDQNIADFQKGYEIFINAVKAYLENKA